MFICATSSWHTLFLAILIVGICCAQDTASARLVLNEVFYDPEGADAGREFVELYNSGPVTISLHAASVHFANGAGDPAWQVRWTGGEGDSLVSGGFYLIVDAGWSGPPAGDAEVSLALQNGPDAVRLVLPDGPIDILGYGELSNPALFETEPHADVASGHSLGRRPDGHDTDHNVADWEPLELPTAKAPNFDTFAAVVDLVLCEPPSLSRSSWPVNLTLQLVNTGLADLPATPVTFQAGGSDQPGWLDQLAPAQSRLLQFTWSPHVLGRQPLRLLIPLPPPSDDIVITLRDFQVGQAGPYLNEVMVAPSQSGCEWVELGNAAAEPVDLSGLSLRDEDGGWHPLPVQILAPHAFMVLAQDRNRFLLWYQMEIAPGNHTACSQQDVSAAVFELPGSWPTLNNSPPQDREFADRLYLGDETGTVLDHVTCGDQEADIQSGRSWERVAVLSRGDPRRNWAVATAQAGSTPTCRNSISGGAEVTAEFTISPNPFFPNQTGDASVLHLLFELTPQENGWDAQIFDLWGHSIRDLGGDALGTGPREILWDGRDDAGKLITTGAYIVLLRTYDSGGTLLSGRKRLAVVSHDEAP